MIDGLLVLGLKLLIGEVLVGCWEGDFVGIVVEVDQIVIVVYQLLHETVKFVVLLWFFVVQAFFQKAAEIVD